MQTLIKSLNTEVDRFVSLCTTDGKQLPSYYELIAQFFSIVAVIEKLENHGLPRHEIVAIVMPARQLLGLSPLYKRFQDWPRGYPGDFETIEYLMASENQAPKGSLAYLFEHYALNSPAAQQHRNKVQQQADLILKTSFALPTPGILSIACGSCPDLANVQHFVNPETSFTLFDLDADALAFSKAKLSAISGRCEFVQGNVVLLERYFRNAMPFNLVLVGGLFDYLDDKWIIRLLRFIWEKLVNPKGMIFFTNISPDNTDRIAMEYFAEWRLIARDEQAVLSLCGFAGIPESAIKIFRDKTQSTVMVEIVKPC